ncbi:DUF6477 family protein [Salipiger mucosus]|uniref:Uncharacterized protein n=1 Tax=Salipiger mucosus DSM 16094 TaxID=1123237 RepID=S9RQD0_9RHOB|nr:DUF6477 family protein [Salipiger mucosus]EPX76209.1 hypothetical protein Salmuc_01993 [Salipiger mucosus DSM 16094]
MKDLLSLVKTLRRPRLLVRAARIGAEDYRREARLPRLLGLAALPRSASALLQLMELEADLDESRRRGDATYSVTRHVEVLSAVMGESRRLRAAGERGAAGLT